MDRWGDGGMDEWGDGKSKGKGKGKRKTEREDLDLSFRDSPVHIRYVLDLKATVLISHRDGPCGRPR